MKMNQAQTLRYGYKCPKRGCRKKKRRYTLGGIFMHIVACHGRKEVEKRLRIRKCAKE